MSVGLDERIAELVDAHRQELQALVDDAIDRQLERLILERLAAKNGNGARVAELVSPGEIANERQTRELVPPLQRVCRVCGERPAQKQRTVCGRCREREKRDRRAAHAEAADDGPRA